MIHFTLRYFAKAIKFMSLWLKKNTQKKPLRQPIGLFFVCFLGDTFLTAFNPLPFWTGVFYAREPVVLKLPLSLSYAFSVLLLPPPGSHFLFLG